ncbi:2-methylisocitrate lyase-like PEP mutase family enzyme [Caulobacter ginsengisoli]|uniref:2-methylisocitrate lyase-like PEP mutase family enzyme n=1 Tax=Caulobacter ginsengisoli TaxID=400775 RepID=A0ABU0IU72_9CAUL|nr:isocitrate lyase/phosphoenolpyruvate mutase family protein [Caulobacter ginsengisoli]MDQ0465558.1 2-methylisocitrate lyase-like PEP mutase family enzyme [Caulobacter ginsengisoli]
MNKAATFRALHQGPDILVLPNAWDAGSAKLMETLGAKAVATSSAAVAWSHGYADGHHMPVEAAVQTVREAARVLSVPLTADIEGGYSDDPKTVGETAAKVIDAGAVGINLEDGGGPAEALAAKIEAVRAAADKAGVKLFINARADVYLRRLATGEAAVAETLRRAALYRAAGADGLFAPGVSDPGHIETLARECGLPLNVMAMPGVPLAGELQQLGARRLSSATGISRAALHAVAEATRAFLAGGDSDALSAAGGGAADYNALFR